MNSKSTNQNDRVLRVAEPFADQYGPGQHDSLDPEVCGCVVCEAVFSAEVVAVCQALAAQFKRDDLAQRVYDRIAELEVRLDLSRKETLRLRTELNSLGDLVFPEAAFVPWADSEI